MGRKKDYQVMPPLNRASYEKLKEDIRENGLAIPIDVDEHGNILDGYHRKKICDELGIPCERTVHPGMTEEEKYDFVLRVNINRRHLTQEQQDDAIRRFKEAHPDMSNRAIADAVGTNDHAVKDALNKCPDAKNSHLDTVKGLDGKSYPADAGKAERQREAVRNVIAGDPSKSDRQVARETGASPSTVGAQRKKMRTFHNPSAREAEALKNSDIIRRLEENEKLTIAGALRAQKRDQLIEHLEDIKTKEAKAAEGVYDVVVVDPPWPMRKIERNVRPNQTSELDYPLMGLEEIKALNVPAADDCHVFLWTTQKYLHEALHVFDAWEVTYVCTFTWVKRNSGMKPFGLPRYNCEFCLYGHIGNPKFIDEKQFCTGFVAQATGHSKKPEEFYEMLRRVTAGRRLDMFSRREIEGFDGWGNEVEEDK